MDRCEGGEGGGVDGWMDGWMDGCVDGWREGRREGSLNVGMLDTAGQCCVMRA
jgi:hypothetical protein